MTITEIKRWAKEKGYTIVKQKSYQEDKSIYYWSSDSNPNVSGIAPSVSKVAVAVFNHLTDNKWVQYQEDYKQNKEYKWATTND